MTRQANPRGRDKLGRGESWAGWVRADTSGVLAATSRTKENTMILKARSRARVILTSGVELYREMALSAISLVRR